MSWWKNVCRRRSQEAELDRELRFHLERQFQEYMNAGLSADDARRRLRLEFGELDQMKEECRDVRPLHWLDDLTRDARLGFRALRREPLFSVSVTIILALGIGTSVTMFSILNTVVLRSLPYARPAELAMLVTHLMAQNQPDGTSPPNLFDWREQSTSFTDMTFYRRTSASKVTFAGADAPQRAQEGLVGPEFFELLGATPLIGRTFSKEEFEGRGRVVVLSQGLWQEQFGRSEAALGQALSIDGEDHVVIGVMPRAFQLPTSDTRFWRPLSILAWWAGARSSRAGDGIEVIGRLAPGIGIDDARTEMSVIAARLREMHVVNRNLDIRVIPLFDQVVGSRTRRGVWLGFAAVLSLLAIACVNVGGMLTARAARRRREFAVRFALGAGRGRLIRQLLAEGLSLWTVASVGGVWMAYVLIRLVLAYGPRALPRMEELRLDLAAVVVAFLGGLAVVILCGTIPALVVTKADASAAFGVSDRSGLPARRLQDLLVIGQIAGAFMLLVGAVLLAESFIRAQSENPGYPAENLLIVRVDLPRTGYRDPPALSKFFREARDRIARLPGVAAVGGITDFFVRRNPDQRMTIEGQAAASLEDGLPKLSIDSVTPGYFRAVGVELLEGKDFEERDLEPGAAGVIIVNESLARRFWPGENAVGKRVVSGASPPKDGRWNTIVGVVKDMRREGLDVPPILSGFVPSFMRGMDLTIRASNGVNHLIPAVRREIRAIDRSLPITYVATADSRLSERLDGRRFEAQVLSVFAAIAVLLSAAGVYALLAYQVALRTREIGIRSALGADRQSIVAMILGRGVLLALAGAAAGIAGAAACARVLQSLLYETAALDAPSYAAAAGFVLLVATAAALVPALRGASVSPMTALRDN